jgi:hypothetical protein
MDSGEILAMTGLSVNAETDPRPGFHTRRGNPSGPIHHCSKDEKIEDKLTSVRGLTPSGSLTLSPRRERGVKSKTNVDSMLARETLAKDLSLETTLSCARARAEPWCDPAAVRELAGTG